MSAPARSGRSALLARVHMAKKELALADDSYRAILARVSGRDSAAAIDDAGLRRVIAEFERLGLKPHRRRPASAKPHVRKVFALWTDMRDVLRDPSREALRAFVLRQTGVADPEWLDGKQAGQVVEALKAWRTRARRAAEKGGEDADAS